MACGRAAEALEKAAAVAYAFDVHPEYPRRRICGHDIDKISRLEYQHVADRRRLVNPDPAQRRL